MSDAGGTRYDMSDATKAISYVLHVDRVAAFSVATTEVGIAGVIRALYLYDKAVDVQNDFEIIDLVMWSMERTRQRLPFIRLRQGCKLLSSGGKELSNIVQV